MTQVPLPPRFHIPEGEHLGRQAPALLFHVGALGPGSPHGEPARPPRAQGAHPGADHARRGRGAARSCAEVQGHGRADTRARQTQESRRSHRWTRERSEDRSNAGEAPLAARGDLLKPPSLYRRKWRSRLGATAPVPRRSFYAWSRRMTARPNSAARAPSTTRWSNVTET